MTKMFKKKKKEEIKGKSSINEQEAQDPEKHHRQKAFMDRDIKIKLTPRSFLRAGLLIIAFLVVFSLGRWSVAPPDFGGVSGFAIGFAEGLADTQSEGAEVAAEGTGIVTEVSADAAEVQETVEPEVVEAQAATATDGTASDAADEVATSTTEDEGVQSAKKVVTSYTGKVALSLSDVKVSWKGTWGKITELEYVIKNNADGIIQPSYLVMMVEGYTDIEKKIPLASSSKELLAGKSDEKSIIIPNKGFSYNEATAGDLTSVDITVYLYDANDKVMAMEKRAFNIGG